MNRHWNSYLEPRLSRRELLQCPAPASARLALAGLLGEEQARSDGGSADPLAVKPPHFPPRAKRVIFLFMHGGPSQVDTFDYKPLLKRDHGKPLPFAAAEGRLQRNLQPAEVAVGIQAVRAERACGSATCFPRFAKRVDDLCFIKSMWGSNSRHGGALLELHTGSDTFVRPSMGSWITYGLGQREPEHAGLHHDLPDAEPRRREQLRLGISARAVRGHADRRGRDPGARREDSVHREHRDAARDPAHGARLSRRS